MSLQVELYEYVQVYYGREACLCLVVFIFIVYFCIIFYVTADRLSQKFLLMLDFMSMCEMCVHVVNKFRCVRKNQKERTAISHSFDYIYSYEITVGICGYFPWI